MNKQTPLRLFTLMIITTAIIYATDSSSSHHKIYCKVLPRTKEQQICQMIAGKEYCRILMTSKLVNLCKVVQHIKGTETGDSEAANRIRF